MIVCNLPSDFILWRNNHSTTRVPDRYVDSCYNGGGLFHLVKYIAFLKKEENNYDYIWDDDYIWDVREQVLNCLLGDDLDFNIDSFYYDDIKKIVGNLLFLNNLYD